MRIVYFKYGQSEINYLKSKDKKLAEAIDKIEMIQRTVIPDLFSALVNSITGQQISTKAHKTIRERMKKLVININPKNILDKSNNELQAIGLSFRKVEYIKNIAQNIINNELDLEELQTLSDDKVISKLSNLKGIGVWTAEMIMIFSMQRKNILSFDDFAIVRGLRMLYHHREI